MSDICYVTIYIFDFATNKREAKSSGITNSFFYIWIVTFSINILTYCISEFYLDKTLTTTA